MSNNENEAGRNSSPADGRRPYVKPDFGRVDLALAETLSGGCKVDMSFCGSTDGISMTTGAGS